MLRQDYPAVVATVPLRAVRLADLTALSAKGSYPTQHSRNRSGRIRPDHDEKWPAMIRFSRCPADGGLINPALPEIAIAMPAKLHHALEHDPTESRFGTGLPIWFKACRKTE